VALGILHNDHSDYDSDSIESLIDLSGRMLLPQQTIQVEPDVEPQPSYSSFATTSFVIDPNHNDKTND
jgi:hypothetical protein